MQVRCLRALLGDIRVVLRHRTHRTRVESRSQLGYQSLICPSLSSRASKALRTVWTGEALQLGRYPYLLCELAVCPLDLSLTAARLHAQDGVGVTEPAAIEAQDLQGKHSSQWQALASYNVLQQGAGSTACHGFRREP